MHGWESRTKMFLREIEFRDNVNGLSWLLMSLLMRFYEDCLELLKESQTMILYEPLWRLPWTAKRVPNNDPLWTTLCIIGSPALPAHLVIFYHPSHIMSSPLPSILWCRVTCAFQWILSLLVVSATGCIFVCRWWLRLFMHHFDE
jgi:hypothetical protein